MTKQHFQQCPHFITILYLKIIAVLCSHHYQTGLLFYALKLQLYYCKATNYAKFLSKFGRTSAEQSHVAEPNQAEHSAEFFGVCRTLAHLYYLGY